jgi:hypothetical protein
MWFHSDEALCRWLGLPRPLFALLSCGGAMEWQVRKCLTQNRYTLKVKNLEWESQGSYSQLSRGL